MKHFYAVKAESNLFEKDTSMQLAYNNNTAEKLCQCTTHIRSKGVNLGISEHARGITCHKPTKAPSTSLKENQG
jgi:hypothetical protein